MCHGLNLFFKFVKIQIMKITSLLTFIGLCLLFQVNSLAQQIKVINQKGTLKTVTSNTVTISNAPPSDPVLSDIWFDTDNNLTKIWDGSNWRAIQAITSKSLWDTDSDTAVQIEESVDEDQIRFDTAGVERVIINNQGNVGIASSSPNLDAALELGATNKGFLPNRVALTSTNSASPLTAHVLGMLVYNTATAGVTPNNVEPGYYYNNGSKWIKFSTGGTGTSGSSPWFGSDDNMSATSNTEDIYIMGNVGIGTNNPGFDLDVNGSMRLRNSGYIQWGGVCPNPGEIRYDGNRLYACVFNGSSISTWNML